ncbi:uncharacterized protein TNCV_2104221 [Trichonephila clavipes]|nr:uncharacterized protein TNCV_2104221 [Trichonephila clavipes]
MSRCPRWSIERDTSAQASVVRPLRSCNAYGGGTYIYCSGIPQEKVQWSQIREINAWVLSIWSRDLLCSSNSNVLTMIDLLFSVHRHKLREINKKDGEAGGIIGPYFFKNDEGHNVTVNGARYRAMMTNFFIPELNNHDVQEPWFQQDGATCHRARATIDLLKDTFGDRLISRFGPVNWPPRSCDLTLLDYFLWGYVKSLVYADKPQTLDHLEDNIRRVIADIRPQMLEKVIENWTSKLDYIRASRGSPMPEIIFKM